ncbi:MAG TPA: hypothetical protein VKV28_11185 [Candidatus Binataceae bacterium]|nr:hypothetical protein [Candidatus Binataceae bacterium]
MKTTLLVAALSLTLASACGGGSKANAQGGFSLASIKGSYAGLFTGKIHTSSGLLPFRGTGVFTADGAGNLSGDESYTVNGVPCSATIQGTYQVNADGSGSDSVKFTASGSGCTSGTYTQSLAIGQAGSLILLVNTNADEISEEWYSQN